MALSKTFGKLPFAKLMEPAIEYADRGFAVAPRTALSWAGSFARFKDFPEWQKTFAPKGRGPHPGEWFSNPDQAKTLRLIGHFARLIRTCRGLPAGHLEYGSGVLPVHA